MFHVEKFAYVIVYKMRVCVCVYAWIYYTMYRT